MRTTVKQETVNVQPKPTKKYYGARLWGFFPQVQQEINRRISGDPSVGWQGQLQRLTNGRRFKRALILNCGKGWVERGLIQKFSLVDEAVGIDISEELLQQARNQAEGLPITYQHVDTNIGELPEGPFDLVINHAACHHIAYLDRVLRKVCTRLEPDGLFVTFDYVGPHRNQYPYEIWSALWNLNQQLPTGLRRKPLDYPHIPTMLANDPSEAVHSELIIQISRRYFDFVEHKHIGGALGYEILSKNVGLQNASAEDQEQWVNFVLEKDMEYLKNHPDSSFFDFFVCRPRKEVLERVDQLQEWKLDEEQREFAAHENRGHYYDLTCFQHLYISYCNKRSELRHKTSYIKKILSGIIEKTGYVSKRT